MPVSQGRAHGPAIADHLRALGHTIAADLVRLQPAPGSWRTAARAGLTMLLALGVLQSRGALDHAAYATFGGFAVVYGGRRPYAGRWRHQGVLAVLLVAAVVSGAATAISPQRAWLAIPVAAGWAAVSAALSDRARWIPPGPLFFVFAVATCAAIPSTAGTVASAALTAAATAAFGIVLGVVEERIARVRGDRPLSPWHAPHRRRIHAARCAVAVALAGLVSTVAGIDRPYWAMVSAVVPLTVATIHQQVVRGSHRLAGTLAGVGVAAVVLALPLPTWLVLVTVAVLQALAELVVSRNYALALLFITPLALLVAHLAAPQPVGALLVARLAETLIGVAVGVLVAVVTRARSGGQPS